MVWFEYILDALHGDGLEVPGSPKSPKSPTIDPRKYIDDEDSMDLYFYLKKLVTDGYYEHMILDEREFNSFSILELINTRKFDGHIEDFQHYRAWMGVYKEHIKMLSEYINRSLRVMGKTIRIPPKLFERFVYHYSTGYIAAF